MNPIYIKEYEFVDILHNDENSIVIIQNGDEPSCLIELDGFQFSVSVCTDKRSKIYKLDNIDYKSNIILKVNEKYIETRVNKYPSWPDEIIMSTVVKYEDEYVIQWIKYHEMFGVTRFVFYDNADNKILQSNYTASKSLYTNLSNILKEYIDNGKVLLINWPYQGDEIRQMFQPNQENHSINAFKKCKYIGFLDVDEYVNPQTSETNLHVILGNSCTNGGYSLEVRNFSNYQGLPEDAYKFMDVYTCDNFIVSNDPNTRGDKVFINPKNVYAHRIHRITSLGIESTLLPRSLIYVNHYRFLNKHFRNRHYVPCVDDSIRRFKSFLQCPPF